MHDSVARDKIDPSSAPAPAALAGSGPDGSDHTLIGTMPEDSPSLRRWAQRRCYGCEISGYRLLVQQAQYCELLSSYRIAPLPNAPEHLLGLTNLRGNLIPVYHLPALLGVAEAVPNYALLIGDPLSSGALTVAATPLQFDLASATPAAIPGDLPEVLTRVITETFVIENKSWSVIDHTRLFRLLASGQTSADG